MNPDILRITHRESNVKSKKIVPKINKEWVDEIIFVDGGSTDGTIEEARKMGFKVIIQKKKGHGAAVLEGVNSINSDNFILFGPDGNDEPEKIPLLIEKMNEGYDQVLVTRFGKGSINLDAGIVDSFGNKMFAFLANVFFGGKWTDTLNESRIISKKAFRRRNKESWWENFRKSGKTNRIREFNWRKKWKVERGWKCRYKIKDP